MSATTQQLEDDLEAWVEGLPEKPGDYWFYIWTPGYGTQLSPGSSALSANGVLMHQAYAVGFLYADTKGRVWYKPNVLPDLPVFDRTCPSCGGLGKKDYLECFACQGKGQIE